MNTIHTKPTTLAVNRADEEGNFTIPGLMNITHYIRGEWDCECGHHTTNIPDEMLSQKLGRCPKCWRKIEKVEEDEKC